MKFISLANCRPKIKTKYSKTPANYQADTISSCLNQLRKYRGSMLVASTGLGKTVIAMHIALHLYKAEEIDYAIVFGPVQGVETNWKDHILDSSLPIEYIGLLALDQAQDNSRIRECNKIQDLLNKKEDFNLLVVIDESHLIRNRINQYKRERLAFKRIKSICHTGNTKVLLMTATPFGKTLEDLNNQLYLLPHTNANSILLFDEMEGSKAWAVESVNIFNFLPVVTQMTTSHVSKSYSKQDEMGNWILRGKERVYIPKLILRTHTIKPVFYNEVEALIHSEVFTAEGEDYAARNITRSILQLVKISLCSSPASLREVLKSVSETGDEISEEIGYKIQFATTQEERQAKITPVLQQLEQYSSPGYALQSDKKLEDLLNIVNSAFDKDLKVLIFSERQPTVLYLERALSIASSKAKVASTVELRPNGRYLLKNAALVQELVTRFAPLANNVYNLPLSQEYNVFIGTDAHGIGINMQDAHIVVNYDISWTPIEPSQRAGRILRFTPNPRNIEVFTIFPGDVNTSHEMGSEIAGLAYQERQGLLNLQQRSERLIERHDFSQEIVRVPILTTEDALEVNLAEGVQEIGFQVVDWEALDRATGLKTSPLFKHFALASKYQDYIDKLEHDIVAAMETASIKLPTLLLALTYQQQVHFLIYLPHRKRLENSVSLNSFFDLTECNQETPTALANRELIEELSHDCIQLWVEQNQANPEEVIRECTLYLVPTAKDKQQEAMNFLELEDEVS